MTRGLSLNSFDAEEALLVVPWSLGSGVEADLGEQPLLSFLGSGDYDVFPISLPCNDRQML